MSIQEKDYILRAIAQFARALARIVGFKNAGEYDEALKVVRETADGLLGPVRGMVDEVDSATAASLIGDAEKTSAYAALLVEQADIYARKGDERRARNDRLRALELYLERSLIAPELDERSRAAIQELRASVGENRLAPRYRKAVTRL